MVGILIIAAVMIVAFGGVSVYQHFSTPKVSNEQQAKTSTNQLTNNTQATTTTNQTTGWQIYTNSQYGFQFQYPSGFFDSGHQPKVLIGDCNYNVFPNACPNINNIVINDQASAGGDINAIKSNLSNSNYWNPAGQKSAVNNVTYCLYQTSDVAMNHQYNSYYYATVTNNKCLVINLNTSTTNCDVYLPIETENIEQQKNYNDCLTTNTNQPIILKQIISTFKFTNPSQTTGCNTNSDCQNGASCMVEGPLIANQPVHKVCVPKGQVVPL